MTNTLTRAPTTLPLRQEKHGSLKQSRVQLLDCARAVACLFVLFSHAGGPNFPGGWSYGTHGVALFCALSGFLITSLLLDEERKAGKFDLVGFLQRRALRIAPIYFAVIAVTLLFMKTGLFLKNHPSEVATMYSGLPGLLTFTVNNGGPYVLGHYWSLSIEEQFYCLLPLFLICVSAPLPRIIGLSIISLLLVRFVPMAMIGNVAFTPLAVGALCAVIRSTPFGARINKVALLGAGLALVSASFVCTLFPYGIVQSAGMALLLWAMCENTKEFACLKPAAYIGRVSYCIYLIHFNVLFVVRSVLAPWNLQADFRLQFLLGALFSVAIAGLSWKIFEGPILRLRTVLPRRGWGVFIAFATPCLIAIGCALRVFNGGP